MVQLSYVYMTTGKTIALTIQTIIVKVMSQLFNSLYRFIIAFFQGAGSVEKIWKSTMCPWHQPGSCGADIGETWAQRDALPWPEAHGRYRSLCCVGGHVAWSGIMSLLAGNRDSNIRLSVVVVCKTEMTRNQGSQNSHQTKQTLKQRT